VRVEDLARRVGERLRTARHDRGWSVAALAGAAGIGKGSLSEIENGIRNPTLSTLYALAGALGLPLSSLLANQAGARVSSPGVAALLLDVHESADSTVEVYRLVLDPGAQHRSVAHGSGVVEHLLLTRGRARVGRIGEQIEISAGESFDWVSDTAHGYAALGEEPVESVLVIRSPGAPTNHSI
jgi:transcriptional regulator with XRE-family HTH domain